MSNKLLNKGVFFLAVRSLRQIKRIIRQRGLQRRRQSSHILDVVNAVEVSSRFISLAIEINIEMKTHHNQRNVSTIFITLFLTQQDELTGSGSCVGYRQMHQRLRDDHRLVVSRYQKILITTFKSPALSSPVQCRAIYIYRVI